MFKLQKKWLELVCVVTLALLTDFLFFDGKLDIALAGLFFQPGRPEDLWPQQHFWLWQGLYDLGYPSAIIGGGAALSVIALGFYKSSLRRFRRRALFFLLVVMLGPGLIVNLVFKDHWGRPRPRDIVEFNGRHSYQPPLVLSEQGGHSFVCGHCSVSFMFFACYFMLRQRRSLALLLSIAYGALMGVSRMSAGGHFVSDILWSAYSVYLLCWFLYYFVFMEFRSEYADANANWRGERIVRRTSQI